VTVGIGIDVVDVARFAESLRRTPSLRDRLFTPAEAELPDQSLAARFAAKEAIAKALGAPGNLAWHDAEVVSLPSGQPTLEMRGTVAARAAELGASRALVSLSHDGGIATAIVLLD
jgi:holo-[acyl-carrier protein] synthase